MFIPTGPLKFLLWSLDLGLQDVRIRSVAVAGVVGPASLYVGAGLRANFWAARQRQAVFLRGHHHRHQVYIGVSGARVFAQS